MLNDQRSIGLDEPGAKYIPSFAKAKEDAENKTKNGEQDLEQVTENHPITIRDLLRHTSGITDGC